MMHAIERSSLCNEEEEQQQQQQQQQQPEKKVSQLFAQRAALRLQDQRRTLKPADLQVMQACPRCQSPNTKFCYYNNYSLTQPRYYCKNCRRYWTAGGTLRNVPVGGSCRKKKEHAGKQLHQAGQSSGTENSETHELSAAAAAAAAATTTTAAEQQQQHALLVGFSSSSSSTTRFTQSSLQGLETSIIGQVPTSNISARLGQYSSSQPFESGNIMSLGLFNSVMRSRAEEEAAGLSSHPARAATSQQVALVHDAGGDNLGGFFYNPVVYSSREGGGALGLTEEGHNDTYNHTEGHGEEVDEAAASYGGGEIIWRNLQQPKQEVLWGQEESIQGGGSLDLNRQQEAKAKFSTPSLSPAHHGLGPHEEAAQPVAWQQPTVVSQGLGMPHYETTAPNTNFWSKYRMATP